VDDSAERSNAGEGDIRRLDIPADVDAAKYNTLFVRMRVSNGSQCRFTWSGALEPSLESNPGTVYPVIADGEFHDYRIPLAPPSVNTWTGRIDRIRFEPSDEVADTEVAELSLVRGSRPAPMRITLGHETREAVFGNHLRWKVKLPQQAVFETYVALLERAWHTTPSGDGVTFGVDVQAVDGKPEKLGEIALVPSTEDKDRGWHRIHADLGRYAGREVTLELRVQPHQSTTGDYALWGAPTVFSQSRSSGEATPVFLIVTDTLRADHLGCYGYERETSPHIDAWSREATLFEHAVAQETWTLPSHITMFTGLYPKNHGANLNSNLSEDTRTLAGILSEEGYLCAGFTGMDWWLLPWRGLGYGFDYYDHSPLSFRHIHETLPRLTTWLDQHPTPRPFVFFHNFDVHSKTYLMDFVDPYDPARPGFNRFRSQTSRPPRIERPGVQTDASHFLLSANRGELSVTDAERTFMIAGYDDCIEMVDAALDEFFTYLKENGLYDSALIIFTSDHGEAFGEHGMYLHEQTYEECSRVPLIIKFPRGKFAGKRVPDPVQLVDLYPTVLDVLGLSPAEPVDGISLLALLEGRIPASEWAYTQRESMQAVRTGAWKLHRHTGVERMELYNLHADPGERSNLIDTNPPVLEKAERELHRFFESTLDGWHVALRAGQEEWMPELSLVTDGTFQSSKSLTGHHETLNVNPEGSIISGQLKAIPGGYQELVIKTTPADSDVYLSVRDDAPFRVALGDRTSELRTEYRVRLDPANRAYWNTPPSTVESAAEPILYIWYVESRTGMSPVAPLPADVEEQLRAIGYGQ
jgi:arylsulfatase A-like enzyme